MDSLQIKSVWEGKEALKEEIRQVEAPKVEGVTASRTQLNELQMENLQATFDVREKLGLLDEDELYGYHIITEKDTLKIMHDDYDTMARQNEKLARLEEKKEKEGVQQERATARLKQGHQYFAATAEEKERMRAAQAKYKLQQKGKIPAAQPQVVNGKEFVLDPESGRMEMSVETLMEKRSGLETWIKNRKKQQLTVDEQIQLEANEKAVKLLGEVIDIWYQANGIDYSNGKEVSNRQKNKAQKQFALKMEQYQDYMENMASEIGHAKLEQLKKEKAKKYKDTKKEMREAAKTSGMKYSQ